MTSTTGLHLAYTSRLAAGCDHTVFGAVCRASRANNAERGIGGVLLFDGQRFFQWLYGRTADVVTMMSSIASDPRHEAVDVHFESVMPVGAVDWSWQAGFVDAAVLDGFVALRGSDEATLIDGIRRLVGQADLEPPLPVALPLR